VGPTPRLRPANRRVRCQRSIELEIAESGRRRRRLVRSPGGGDPRSLDSRRGAGSRRRGSGRPLCRRPLTRRPLTPRRRRARGGGARAVRMSRRAVGARSARRRLTGGRGSPALRGPRGRGRLGRRPRAARRPLTARRRGSPPRRRLRGPSPTGRRARAVRRRRPCARRAFTGGLRRCAAGGAGRPSRFGWAIRGGAGRASRSATGPRTFLTTRSSRWRLTRGIGAAAKRFGERRRHRDSQAQADCKRREHARRVTPRRRIDHDRYLVRYPLQPPAIHAAPQVGRVMPSGPSRSGASR
jgi:hypothetical protein